MATPTDLAHTPVMSPPPGVQSNFINPETAGNGFPIFASIGLVFATAFLVMRMYTKACILKKFGADDVAVISAYIFTVGTIAIMSENRVHGTGRHVWDVPVTMFGIEWGQYDLAGGETYLMAIMSAKLAIIICYLRISPQKYFRLSLYTTMFFVAGYHIAFVFALIFGCNPIAKSWDLSITTGHCINRTLVYLINGILNVVSDFIILLLPLPMIKNIQMPLRQKLLVAGFFSVGSLACVISIVRLRSLIPLLHAVDFTWANADAASWIAIELCVVITCGCLSVARPFLRHVFPSLMGDTDRQTSRTKYSKGAADFFLYNRRHRAEQTGSTGSVTQLGQPYLDSSWNNTEYIQDIRATKTADPNEVVKPRSTDDDLELGDIKENEAGDPHALSHDLPQEGIMIKKEVDVNRK